MKPIRDPIGPQLHVDTTPSSPTVQGNSPTLAHQRPTVEFDALRARHSASPENRPRLAVLPGDQPSPGDSWMRVLMGDEAGEQSAPPASVPPSTGYWTRLLMGEEAGEQRAQPVSVQPSPGYWTRPLTADRSGEQLTPPVMDYEEPTRVPATQTAPTEPPTPEISSPEPASPETEEAWRPVTAQTLLAVARASRNCNLGAAAQSERVNPERIYTFLGTRGLTADGRHLVGESLAEEIDALMQERDRSISWRRGSAISGPRLLAIAISAQKKSVANAARDHGADGRTISNYLISRGLTESGRWAAGDLAERIDSLMKTRDPRVSLRNPLPPMSPQLLLAIAESAKTKPLEVAAHEHDRALAAVDAYLAPQGLTYAGRWVAGNHASDIDRLFTERDPTLDGAGSTLVGASDGQRNAMSGRLAPGGAPARASGSAVKLRPHWRRQVSAELLLAVAQAALSEGSIARAAEACRTTESLVTTYLGVEGLTEDGLTIAGNLASAINVHMRRYVARHSPKSRRRVPPIEPTRRRPDAPLFRRETTASTFAPPGSASQDRRPQEQNAAQQPQTEAIFGDERMGEDGAFPHSETRERIENLSNQTRLPEAMQDVATQTQALATAPAEAIEPPPPEVLSSLIDAIDLVAIARLAVTMPIELAAARLTIADALVSPYLTDAGLTPQGRLLAGRYASEIDQLMKSRIELTPHEVEPAAAGPTGSERGVAPATQANESPAIVSDIHAATVSGADRPLQADPALAVPRDSEPGVRDTTKVAGSVERPTSETLLAIAKSARTMPLSLASEPYGFKNHGIRTYIKGGRLTPSGRKIAGDKADAIDRLLGERFVRGTLNTTKEALLSVALLARTMSLSKASEKQGFKRRGIAKYISAGQLTVCGREVAGEKAEEIDRLLGVRYQKPVTADALLRIAESLSNHRTLEAAIAACDVHHSSAATYLKKGGLTDAGLRVAGEHATTINTLIAEFAKRPITRRRKRSSAGTATEPAPVEPKKRRTTTRRTKADATPATPQRRKRKNSASDGEHATRQTAKRRSRTTRGESSAAVPSPQTMLRPGDESDGDNDTQMSTAWLDDAMNEDTTSAQQAMNEPVDRVERERIDDLIGQAPLPDNEAQLLQPETAAAAPAFDDQDGNALPESTALVAGTLADVGEDDFDFHFDSDMFEFAESVSPVKQGATGAIPFDNGQEGLTQPAHDASRNDAAQELMRWFDEAVDDDVHVDNLDDMVAQFERDIFASPSGNEAPAHEVGARAQISDGQNGALDTPPLLGVVQSNIQDGTD